MSLIQSNFFVMNKTSSKLILGSANFGLNYGVANQSGKISKSELAKILAEAKAAGIEMIDTAQAYGNSESRIGCLLGDKRLKLITKISSGLEEKYAPNRVSSLVQKSCERLKRPNLYAVMIHKPEILLSPNGKEIIKELEVLKEQNVISKLGVSIYSSDILSEITTRINLDIIQAPFNIIDQNILLSGWVERLKDNNIEIHTRSAFLQGLLLLTKSNLHSYFTNNWPKLFQKWFDFLDSNSNDAVYCALSYVLNQPWIDKVVVGVDSSSQLKSLVHVEKSFAPTNFPELKCSDENLTNPSKWKLK